MTTAELERAAYANGDARTAELLARLAELEEERETLADQLDDVRGELRALEDEMTDHAHYREFFADCFERLAGHYPCPSVTSDHDKMVIFEAIERGESCPGEG